MNAKQQTRVYCFRHPDPPRHRQLDEIQFLRHYEPDVENVLNTKRDDGLLRYWKSKRSDKRVHMYDIFIRETPQ